ncbi:MAG: cell envelope integrity protein TolA [Pseudomonadota bacterium]
MLDNALPLTVTVIGHVLLVALLLVGLRSAGGAQPVAANIIEGAVVGPLEPSPIEVEPIPVPIDEPEPIDDNAEQLAREQAEREQREADERRRAEEARLAEEQRIAEQQRRAEEQRLVEEKRRAEEARLAEEKRLAEEQRLVEEARLAEERRKAEQRRKEQERRAAEERERKAAAERARAAQEARRKREAEEALQAAIADEEAVRDAVDSGQQAAYVLAIKQRIQRFWSPPPVSGRVDCVLLVRQLRTGDLANVESVECGGNEPLERSLRSAAERASPFPLPDDMRLWDANLRILFSNEDQ